MSYKRWASLPLNAQRNCAAHLLISSRFDDHRAKDAKENVLTCIKLKIDARRCGVHFYPLGCCPHMFLVDVFVLEQKKFVQFFQICQYMVRSGMALCSERSEWIFILNYFTVIRKKSNEVAQSAVAERTHRLVEVSVAIESEVEFLRLIFRGDGADADLRLGCSWKPTSHEQSLCND
jgi:hypothetical protein